MPPLKGIDRGINGELLKALEESGHRDRIVVVDPSYPIPYEARVYDYGGDSSARALAGVLALVPWEGVVTYMEPDPEPGQGRESVEAFEYETSHLEQDGEPIALNGLYGRSELNEDGTGFYDIANDIEEWPTIFVRTRDDRAFACATFIVGHSQS